MNHVLSTDTTNYLHSVLNPANYELLKNGSAINGGIVQVYYGLDIANQLGTQYGLNIPRMNKYEAVLIVDGNGSGPGTVPLSDGQYQLVVLSSVRDVVGNPMRSTGLSQNGSAMSGLINVTVPTGQETKVNSDAADSNTTYGKYTTADTANSVAADADGDYVVAWTDTTPGNQGVWAKMYQQTSTLNRRRFAEHFRLRVERDGDFGRSQCQRHCRRPLHRRRLRRHLVVLERDHRLGRLRPTLRRFRHGEGEHFPRQLDYRQHPAIFGRGDGRRRRLRHHLAKPRPGRRRLRHLRPGVQRAGQRRRRHQRRAGDRLPQRFRGHVLHTVGQRQQLGHARPRIGADFLHRQRRHDGCGRAERDDRHRRRRSTSCPTV